LFFNGQGINFDVNIDGAPAGVIAGVAGANPNELCIQLPMVANQTCDLISFNITFNAITCNNGDAIAGPASPSLANDLNAGGGIVINVYPNLTMELYVLQQQVLRLLVWLMAML